MNKTYKSVWNESLGAWVAASELSRARGKKSGSIAKAMLASAVTLGTAGVASASVSLDGGGFLGPDNIRTNGIAIGTGSGANNDYGVALGSQAQATGINDIAIGAGTLVKSNALTGDGGALGSVGVGSNAHALASSASAFGGLANASGLQSTALGSHATASATASTAIGMSAIADRDNTVSIGNSSNQRQLVQVARGTQGTDAVNLSQLTPVVAALGGG
ncbi:MAG: hypothetical protein M3O74_09875, partial [Pseudomonadota bacterium]|nr:hypothetical protein [Pseudomonadota bacterium]